MREHKYWTYIVASATGTLYIGMTNSLERRIGQHKAGSTKALPPNTAAIASSTGKASTTFAKQSIGKSS